MLLFANNSCRRFEWKYSLKFFISYLAEGLIEKEKNHFDLHFISFTLISWRHPSLTLFSKETFSFAFYFMHSNFLESSYFFDTGFFLLECVVFFSSHMTWFLLELGSVISSPLVLFTFITCLSTTLFEVRTVIIGFLYGCLRG